MPLRIAVLVCLMSLACSVAARAADDGAVTITPPTASADTVTATTEPAATPPLPAWVAREAQKRPTALSALYGSYGTLAVADLISSKKAFAAGAHERNPIMGSGAVTRPLTPSMTNVDGSPASVVVTTGFFERKASSVT